MKSISKRIYFSIFTMLLVQALAYSQTDNIGINTIQPEAQLHVVGDSIIFESSQYGNRLIFSLEEFRHIIKSAQDITIEVDSARILYLNPDEPNARVAIGSSYSNDNSVLTISSNNKGILIPRLIQDSINAITPTLSDDGLLVFNTTSQSFNVYANGAWQELSIGNSGGLWTEDVNGDVHRLSKVGVGVSNPSEQLEVGGNVALRGDRFDMKTTTGNSNDFSIVRGGSDVYLGATKTGADLFVQADDELRFRTKDTTYKERMVIKNNGFVGIGTNNPDGHLHVVGNLKIDNANNGGVILFDNGNNVDGLITVAPSPDSEQELLIGGLLPNTDVRLSTSDSIKFTTGIGNISVITDQGDVGIGLLSPSQKLQVDGAINLGSTDTPTEGTMRYLDTVQDFQGYDGTSWKSLTAIEDADADPSNEIQVLTDESDPGSTVQVGIAVPGSPVQDVNITTAITSLPGYINDGDNDDQNEIQQLGLNGNVLSLTNGGGTVTIPTSGGGGASLWTDNGSQDIYYNAGKVGIGTTTPDELLDIKGDILIEDNNNGAIVTLKSDDGGALSARDENGSIQGYLGWENSTNEFIIENDGEELIRHNGSIINLSDDLDINGSIEMHNELSIDNNLVKLSSRDGTINQGFIELQNEHSIRTIKLDGQASSNDHAHLSMYNGDLITNTKTIELNTNFDNIGSARIELNDFDGNNNIQFRANETSNGDIGGSIRVRGYGNNNTTEQTKVFIEANDQNNRGGSIKIYNYDGGSPAIRIESNFNGTNDARIVTDELQINGGSDFAEHFDIISREAVEPMPGMIVSIDPASTGKLEITKIAYDRKVAGIISGANGVETGLMMGQCGSIADGDYPVALSGRVYVYANKEGGDIQPGDLLTTSSSLGYAMKVNDYTKAQGAIIGKAMTTIDENGFVLVLVNLQ